MAFPEEKEAWEQEKKKKGGYDMELINKDALKKDILALPNCYNGFSDTYDKACIIGVIDEQPTVEERKTGKWIDVACPNCGCKIHIEPERKTGRWEEIEVIAEAYDIAGVKTWASKMQCDQCGFSTFAIEGCFSQYHFCPNCGASMSEGEEHEDD